jgi:hypothetical protein
MTTFLVIEPTIALLLIFVGLLPLFRGFAETFAYTMIAFLVFAAVGAVVSIIVQLPIIKWLVIALSAIFCVSVWIIARKSSWSIHKAWLGSIPLFFGLVVVSQLITRSFGLSSVAFTDGHTILALGQAIQQGTPEALSGMQALKRGFALPAMESLGLDGEYFVGLMPLFFIAALLATYALLKHLFPDSTKRLLAMFMLGALAISTEAIARHIYLENTHSMAWLLSALLLGAIVKISKDGLDVSTRIGLLLLFSAIGFTRFDYVLLFLPALLYVVILLIKQKSKFGFALVAANLASLMFWTLLAVRDFPVFGQFGPVLILLFGLLGYLLLQLFIGSTRISFETLTTRLFWILMAASLVSILVFANVWPFIRNLAVNLFLGEGLWGATAYLFLVLWLVVGFFTKWKTGSSIHSQLAQIGILMFTVYLNLKMVDAFNSGSTRPGIVRIGFGDSLNRTLVTWLPFGAILLNRALDLLQPDGSKTKSKT